MSYICALQPAQGRSRQRKRAAPVEQAETPLDIVFVSSEVAPWSKTGGLGDVVGSLPIALAARGHRVMVVAPRCAVDCLVWLVRQAGLGWTVLMTELINPGDQGIHPLWYCSIIKGIGSRCA